MISSPGPTLEETEEVDVTTPDSSVDGGSVEGTAAKPASAIAPIAPESTDNCKDDEQQGDEEGAPVTSTASLLGEGCNRPPAHVRKSLDTALRVVGNQTSNPPAPNASATTTPGSRENVNMAQVTDILLARLITKLSDSSLGNPALLLQTLLGFSPEDYSDLLAALSESGCSYVDIIAAYLHNIRVMSEDSGSTSAALSGTLTRSLIEQYNALLTQALRAPRNHVPRPGLNAAMGELLGQGSVTDLLMPQPNGTRSSICVRPGPGGPGGRCSLDSSIHRGPSGLGFGRRSLDSARTRQNALVEAPLPPLGTQRMIPGDTNQLTQALDGVAAHQKRPASIDLGQMLAAGGRTSPAITSPQLVNQALLQQQALAAHPQEHVAGLLQNIPVPATPYAHPGATVQMPSDSVGSLGVLNSAVGLMAPTLPSIPTLQQGLTPGVSSLPNGVNAEHLLAGHGIIPQWPHLGAVNGQTALNPLHLAGAAPQTWEHLSTIHENSGVAITPEQVAAVAAAAGHGVPLANMSSQRYQVPNGGPGDGFAGMES